MDCSIDRVGSFTLISLLPPTTLMVGLLMEVPVTPAIDTPPPTQQLPQGSPAPTLPSAITVQQLGWVTQQALLRHYRRQFAPQLRQGAYQKVTEQRRRDSVHLPRPYQSHCSCSPYDRSACGATGKTSPSFCYFAWR